MKLSKVHAAPNKCNSSPDSKFNKPVEHSTLKDSRIFKVKRFMKTSDSKRLLADSENKELECFKTRSSALWLKHGSSDFNTSSFTVITYILMILSYVVVALSLPFSLIFCIKILKEYERAVIFRLSRLYKSGGEGPGVVFVLPCMDKCIKVDTRTVSLNVPSQDMNTRDLVTVSVAVLVYYQVINPALAVTMVGNAQTATAVMTRVLTRNIIGSNNLSSVILDRYTICKQIKFSLDANTKLWGITVEQVEFANLRLPDVIQKTLEFDIESEAEKRVESKVEHGKQAAADVLMEASRITAQSSTALQLKYLHSLDRVTDLNQKTTIFFPMPIDIMPQSS